MPSRLAQTSWTDLSLPHLLVFPAVLSAQLLGDGRWEGASFLSSCNCLDSSVGKVILLHTKAPMSCQRPECSISPKLLDSELFCPAAPPTPSPIST